MKNLTASLITVILLLTFSVSALAEVTTDYNVIYGTNYAAEYKKVIEDIINEYGVSVKSQYNDNNTNGFVHADLIDFNSDDTPELYLCYKKDAEKTTAKDVYVEAIYCFGDGQVYKIYEDSNDLTEDYRGTLFYTNNGTTYILRENSTEYTNYNAENEFEKYHKDMQLKIFYQGSFMNIVTFYSVDVYSKSEEYLKNNNLTTEKGYKVDSFELNTQTLHHASKYTYYEKGKAHSITAEFLKNNDIYEKYTGKRYKTDKNGYLTELGKQYIHYTDYGVYPDKNLSYNSEEILSLLDTRSKELNPLITVMLDGKILEFDTTPVIYKDRTLVPMRKIFEVLGAEVSWDDETRTAIATKDDITVKVPVNKNAIYINDKEIELDVAAKIVNSRTLVPARAVTEAFGCKVNWDGAEKTVIITSKK